MLANADASCCGRTLLVSGDYFLGAVLAAALTKLDLRLRAMPNSKHSHKDTAACMMIISGIMELGTARQASHPIDGDSGTFLIIIRISLLCLCMIIILARQAYQLHVTISVGRSLIKPESQPCLLCPLSVGPPMYSQNVKYMTCTALFGGIPLIRDV